MYSTDAVDGPVLLAAVPRAGAGASAPVCIAAAHRRLAILHTLVGKQGLIGAGGRAPVGGLPHNPTNLCCCCLLQLLFDAAALPSKCLASRACGACTILLAGHCCAKLWEAIMVSQAAAEASQNSGQRCESTMAPLLLAVAATAGKT